MANKKKEEKKIIVPLFNVEEQQTPWWTYILYTQEQIEAINNWVKEFYTSIKPTFTFNFYDSI